MDVVRTGDSLLLLPVRKLTATSRTADLWVLCGGRKYAPAKLVERVV
jgi:hypothetical protein